MFLCDDCLKKFNIDDFWADIASRSRGPCESCKKSAICYDIHHSAIRPAKYKATEEKQKVIEEQKKVTDLMKKIGY
jgi:hypothetical protein